MPFDDPRSNSTAGIQETKPKPRRSHLFAVKEIPTMEKQGSTSYLIHIIRAKSSTKLSMETPLRVFKPCWYTGVTVNRQRSVIPRICRPTKHLWALIVPNPEIQNNRTSPSLTLSGRKYAQVHTRKSCFEVEFSRIVSSCYRCLKRIARPGIMYSLCFGREDHFYIRSSVIV